MNNVKLAPLLLIFAEVAGKRSYTAAAKKLGISKSAASQQIKRLEEAIGQQLLIRNTRGVVLTAVGEALLIRSELLSEQLNMAFTEINSKKDQPSGHFKVSVPPFSEKEIVMPAIKQLCLEFPQLVPEVVVTEKWHDLIEHKLDAAIFGGDIKNCDYRALSVGKVSEIFCASPRYIAQYGSPKRVEDLSAHQFIATAWHRKKLEIFDNQGTNKKLIAVKHCVKVNTLTTGLEAVLHDMGIALLPEFLVRTHFIDHGLLRVLPDIKGREWHFYFLHQYKGEKPLHIARFYQLYRHYFLKASSSAISD
ncbi:LysR family transcriptional regulator [Vibrio gazogenes]|uniref:DNA-binding transcriptional regulator, LysR family n=1 Tax=Vibrio gazogenes DSM 21264 = NBRC 103151 TaxID=1123492 RepID=A0A1M5GRK8_VIBGA|nr:LysR family transcriptional regulator [Vibrio gazogenes]USP13770.1 LysR family transcriptional regulator [Vibrio gazogenes]SHG06356.1 DNA-binding transcriptional regulator, LysR family [Vibrio gazogenes DSM 21264] [Vibrio gazogenes DSM 21264 = NBRC 103151]SJN53289.1 HTH-type transcriptional regulator DmlR [Vibrio gazogenes]